MARALIVVGAALALAFAGLGLVVYLNRTKLQSGMPALKLDVEETDSTQTTAFSNIQNSFNGTPLPVNLVRHPILARRWCSRNSSPAASDFSVVSSSVAYLDSIELN